MTPMAAPGRLNFLGRSDGGGGSKTSLRAVFRGGRQSVVVATTEESPMGHSIIQAPPAKASSKKAPSTKTTSSSSSASAFTFPSVSSAPSGQSPRQGPFGKGGQRPSDKPPPLQTAGKSPTLCSTSSSSSSSSSNSSSHHHHHHHGPQSSQSVFTSSAGRNSDEQTPLLQTEDSTETSELDEGPATSEQPPPPPQKGPPPSSPSGPNQLQQLPPPSSPAAPSSPKHHPSTPSPSHHLQTLTIPPVVPPPGSPTPHHQPPSPFSSPPFLPPPLVPTPADGSPTPFSATFPRSAPDLRVDFSEVEGEGGGGAEGGGKAPAPIQPPDINRLSAPSPTIAVQKAPLLPDEHEPLSVVAITSEQQLQLRKKAEALLVDLEPEDTVAAAASVLSSAAIGSPQATSSAGGVLVDCEDTMTRESEILAAVMVEQLAASSARSSNASIGVPDAASTGGAAALPLEGAGGLVNSPPHQLPDLTGTMTARELHDFEMRYGSPHHSYGPSRRHASAKHHRHRRHHSSSHRHPSPRALQGGSPKGGSGSGSQLPALHHSRSQSVKASKKRADFLSLPHTQRSRVASMPNELGSSMSGDEEEEEEYYRLRHFSITGKGVVHNRGDSLKSRRSRSNNSVASSASSHSTEFLLGGMIGGICSYPGSARTSGEVSLASSRGSSASGVCGAVHGGGGGSNASFCCAGMSVGSGGGTGAEPGTAALPYRVVMLGASGVGKSSLVSQFMTSEYMHAYDTSLDEEFGEKSVSVLLDGEESELTFIDHPSSEMSPENCISTYEAHAYVVVYSTSDRASVAVAEETLQCLWKSASVSTRAVILVANKTDLVRSRVVSTEEGKSMATSYDCKFIETSVGIQHNVDELLVGVLTQIRLKLEDPERSRALFRKRSSRRRNRSSAAASSGDAGAGSAAGGSGSGGSGSGAGGNKYRGSKSAGVTSSSLKMARGLLEKVWPSRCDSKSKSCENLHVL
ncbi:atrophin-1-like [Ischnura elegans]|uniref:atrophin-1-like n=1 Tax=Ischnura elegans TaxID=197161 RepID=UPI001ED8AFB6|nr:atrophin-1-like [Ischnura elegans]